MVEAYLLKQIEILRNISESALEEIGRKAFTRHFAPGAEILCEGEPCTAVYFVQSGEVRIYRMAADGRAQVIARMTKGQAFNTVPPLLADCRNHSSAESVETTTLYGLSTTDYQNLLQTCPGFAHAMLQSFAERLTTLTDMVESLGLHSVRGRLARFILEQGDRVERARWTQDELAGQLGTVRDVIGRNLRAFEDAGYIRRERQRIVIVNRAGLENEAQT